MIRHESGGLAADRVFLAKGLLGVCGAPVSILIMVRRFIRNTILNCSILLRCLLNQINFDNARALIIPIF